MGKVRHRKRVRQARVDAANAPVAQQQQQGSEGKKVGRKAAEANTLLTALRSTEEEERLWASTALAAQVLELPPGQLRLLLGKNLIGLLIERLSDDNDEVAVECLGCLRSVCRFCGSQEIVY